MSIDQPKVIDIIADDESDRVTLFITDHLPWDHSTTTDHFAKLQDKLNSYLAFIERGELIQNRPAAVGRRVVIEVRGKYALSDVAQQFYSKASEVVQNAGFELRFKLSP